MLLIVYSLGHRQRKRPMPQYFAFLRGLNVGGHRVKMDHLRSLFEQAGFTDVQTYIASGNVIFRSPSTDVPALERQVESMLKEALGYEVATFIRTTAELQAIATNRMFDVSPDEHVHAILVMFMREPLPEEAREKVLAFKTPFDEFAVEGREIYWLTRRRISDSDVMGSLFDKAVRVPTTMRNMNTIEKLVTRFAAEE